MEYISALLAAKAVAEEGEKRGWFEFGTGQQTHVANRYHEPIYAAVRTNLKDPKAYSRIPTGEYLKFVPDHTVSMTAYISIKTVNKDGSVRDRLCDNLQKRADKSVMVNEKGHVVDTVYGDIWKRAY